MAKAKKKKQIPKKRVTVAKKKNSSTKAQHQKTAGMGNSKRPGSAVKKTAGRKFRRLSNVEHVRLRTGMWLGQNSHSLYEQHFFKFDGRSKKFSIIHKEIEEIPAKMKCLDEACMNCVDEYRRNQADKKLPPRMKMSRIAVVLSEDRKRISIEDNGRGIPVVNAEGVYLHLMYGENFDDKAREEHLAGQNGVGISLVRIVSSFFKVVTQCQQKSYTKIFTATDSFIDLLKSFRFNQELIDEVIKYFDEHSNIDGCDLLTPVQKKKCAALMSRNGMKESVKKVPAAQHGTFVEFELKPTYFNGLDIRFDPELAEQYLIDIALTNPGLEVTFDHKKEKKAFCFPKGLDEIFDHSDVEYYKMAYKAQHSPSQMNMDAYIIMDTNKHLTWVNSNFSSLGGSAIEYLENRICDEVRQKATIRALEKKLKTQSTRNDVRSCFHMIVNLKILHPRFKSQDKSYLINDLNAEIREAVDCHLDKLLRKTDLINSIKSQMEKRTHLKALEDATKGVRRASRVTIPKLVPPTGLEKLEGRILFIAEGDSAIAGIRPVRTPEIHGLFPIRGKPLNVKNMSLAKAMQNEEFKNIVAIIGLPLKGKMKTISELNYDKVSIITDADFDGYAIRSLLLSFFYEFWPELYNLGFVHVSATPLYEVDVSKNGKKELHFCIDDDEFEKLAAKVKGMNAQITRKKRNKGLGETSKAAMKFALDNCMTVIHIANKTKASDIQRLWFHKEFAEERRKVIAAYAMKFYEE